jgi:ankyrin repeat protein
MFRVAILVAGAMALSACAGIERPRFGSDQELALAKATLSGDVTAVRTLLDAHADPNLMVDVNDRNQSPWYLALDQVRPDRPASVEIITAMLRAGADPNSAWGTGGGDVTQLPESRWRRFMNGARVASTSPRNPMAVVMLHPTPAAVRALVDAHIDPRLGQSALVSAIESSDADIARILVDAGVDVNCRPGANTPLVAAIEARNVPLMTYLEEHGAREKP